MPQLHAIACAGHSLGAGAAVAVGLMLRPRFPNLRVWAFAPPGGLLSPKVRHDVNTWSVLLKWVEAYSSELRYVSCVGG